MRRFSLLVLVLVLLVVGCSGYSVDSYVADDETWCTVTVEGDGHRWRAEFECKDKVTCEAHCTYDQRETSVMTGQSFVSYGDKRPYCQSIVDDIPALNTTCLFNKYGFPIPD